MMQHISFSITLHFPFRLDYTVWVLRRKAKNLIDQWSEQEYSRVLVLDNQPVLVQVRQEKENKLFVIASADKIAEDYETKIKHILTKMLGLSTETSAFYALADENRELKNLSLMFKGVKPTRFPTVFEALVNAIACQQISLDVGILVLNRLAEKYGKRVGERFAFPEPSDLIETNEEEIKKLGFSYQKAHTILTVSQAILSGNLDVSDFEKLSNSEVIKRLTKLKGIGRWSAEYVLLRGLGRLDIFPGDDVGGQKNLMSLFKLEKRPTYDEIQKLLNPWHSYGGFIYFHLLLDKIQKKGLV